MLTNPRNRSLTGGGRGGGFDVRDRLLFTSGGREGKSLDNWLILS